MGLRYNPITKQYEDDGLGEGAVVPTIPAIAPVDPAALVQPPEQQLAGGAPRGPAFTPDNPGTVQIAPSPRPAWETTNKTRTTTPSAAEQAGVTRQAIAEGGVASAREQMTGVETEEDRIRAGQSAEELRLHDQEQARLQQEEEDFQKSLAVRAGEELATISAAAKSKVRAGRSNVEYWKDFAVGEFVAAITRAVAAAEHARQGKDGLSPAERILNENQEHFRQKLLAEADADAELRDLKLKDRPRWEAAQAHIRKVAADKNIEAIKRAKLVADKAIAQMAPERRAAASAVAAAAEEKANAREELERVKGLRQVAEYERVNRAQPTGAGAAGLGKPTADTRKAAGQGGVILGALKEALTSPQMSKAGLEQIAKNQKLARWGEKAPVMDLVADLTPIEGELTGMAEGDRMALRNTSQLAGAVTYLTTGAAQTDKEAQGRLAELRLSAAMSPKERAQVARIALRYADQARSQGGPNWTPQHEAAAEELRAVMQELEGGAQRGQTRDPQPADLKSEGVKPPAPTMAPGEGVRDERKPPVRAPLRGPGSIDDLPLEQLQGMLQEAATRATTPKGAAQVRQIGEAIARKRKAAAGGR